MKRAPHWAVQSRFRVINIGECSRRLMSWASEASATLGCSIEISRDKYRRVQQKIDWYSSETDTKVYGMARRILSIFFLRDEQG